MTQTNPEPDITDQRANKARMLISILGNDFTRKSQHPFFRTLTEAAAKPTITQQGQPDISRALKNLMSHLSSRDGGVGLKVEAPKQNTVFSPETYVSADQHPALIASSLAKMDGNKKRAVLRRLNGPLACKVLVYMREIEDKSA